MLDYIDEILYTFDKAYTRGGSTKSSAAPVILFKIDKECKKLNSKKVVVFHHLATKLLFANKQARPDTCDVSSFFHH